MIGPLVTLSVRLVAGLPEPDPVRDPDDVRQAAESILSSSDFDEPQPSVLDRIFGWIGDVLSDIGSGVAGSGGSTVVTWIILGAAAAGLAWVAFRVVSGLAPVAPVPRGGTELDVTIVARRSAAELRAEAEDLERQGEWRLATRGWYRVMVARLIEDRVVDDVVGWTPREVLGALPADVTHDAVTEATDRFEQVWYADMPATADSVAALRSVVDRATDLATTGGRRR